MPEPNYLTRDNVYVVELAGKDGTRADPGVVHVGQTVRSPQERFRQHRLGVHAARAGRRRGLWLRWRLFEAWNPLASRRDAEEAEQHLAAHLRSRGYTVLGGHSGGRRSSWHSL
jgi:hypothetical protein